MRTADLPVNSDRDRLATAEAIRDYVTGNGFKAGDRLGAERELAQQLGITRWSVRRALELLEQEGLVTRLHGRSGGVFVAHSKIVRDLDDLAGLPTYLRNHGLTAETSVLRTATTVAGDRLAASLEIDEKHWVLTIERLRFASGVPISIETCVFPAEMFPGLLDCSLVGSLYDLLEVNYDLQRGEAIEHISAGAADEAESASLRVRPGSPLLIVTRYARNSDGDTFEYARERYRADRVSVTAHAAALHPHGALTIAHTSPEKAHLPQSLTDAPDSTPSTSPPTHRGI